MRHTNSIKTNCRVVSRVVFHRKLMVEFKIPVMIEDMV